MKESTSWGEFAGARATWREMRSEAELKKGAWKFRQNPFRRNRGEMRPAKKEEKHSPTLIGPEDRAERVQEMFNSIAPRYDLVNSLMTLGLDKSWRRFTAHRSGLKPGGCGLDLCCGTAMLTMELASAVSPSGIVAGLDFSEKMLVVAMKNLERFALKDNVRLIRGQAGELPFRDNTFDCATIGWGLRSLPDIPAGLREMARVVKPGGKVVSLDVAQPGIPGFRYLYWLYFKRIIPVMGKCWTQNREAYQYLYSSARAFPHPEELAWMFRQTALVETGFHNLAGGIVAVVEGKKPIP
jgi:demethylmenaquinone methyltransferase / 2-methoxy-6-polyprenyl-1,4-benzoquinol methylase